MVGRAEVKPSVGLYWATGEGHTEDRAVEAILATWDVIQRVTPTSQWFERGYPAQSPVARQDVGRVLTRGVNRDDGEGLPIRSLGLRLSVWDGIEGSFGAAVGGTDRTWRGSCTFSVPGLPTHAAEATPLLRELIEIWQPEWATWSSTHARELGRDLGLSRGPRLGLLTWVRSDLISPFAGAGAVSVDGGTLYTFADELDDITQERVRPIVVGAPS